MTRQPAEKETPSQRSDSSSSGWEDHELAQQREFLALTTTQKFELLMHALEFMQALDRPRVSLPTEQSKPGG